MTRASKLLQNGYVRGVPAGCTGNREDYVISERATLVIEPEDLVRKLRCAGTVG